MREVTPEDTGSLQPTKNGQQIGADNVERLRIYVNSLKESGARLPSRNGKPDKSTIALAAGFNRQTLYNNPEAITLLEQAVINIGLERDKPKIDGRAAYLQNEVEKRDRRTQSLEEKLQTKIAENGELRRENRELRERLRQYEIMEEVMTTSGRRFSP